MSEKMRPLWSREPCSVCGAEGLASRSMPVPASKAYVCGDCEMYQRGYDDGTREVDNLRKRLAAAEAERDEYRDLWDELKGSLDCRPGLDELEAERDQLKARVGELELFLLNDEGVCGHSRDVARWQTYLSKVEAERDNLKAAYDEVEEKLAEAQGRIERALDYCDRVPKVDLIRNALTGSGDS